MSTMDLFPSICVMKGVKKLLEGLLKVERWLTGDGQRTLVR